MYLPLFEKPSKNINKSLDKITYAQTYPNQNFVLSFLHPNTPYRGLLLTFQLGNGKTYVASALAHLYNIYGFNVLFLAHNISTLENFKKEYHTFINDNQVIDTSKSICYMGITRFLSSNYDINNHLIIIDEAHNIRESANRYHKLHSLLHSYKNIRILIITATPMIDKINEINSLRNLIEKDAPMAYSDKIYTGVEKVFVGEDTKIGTLYISKFKGKQLNEYTSLLKNSHKDIYTKIRQTSLSLNCDYDPNIGLDEQSAKIYTLLNSLVEGELVVVFSFFVKRGIHFLRDVLKYNGWREWDTTKENKPSKTFAILDGKTSIDSTSNIINIFNSIQNKSGELISLLIGSSVINESITLRNVQHVHILTPFWNYGQIRQAIGRVIRMRSHDDFISSHKIKVNIYLHATIINNNEEDSIDISMYKVAFDKDKLIENQLEYMKQNSIWDTMNDNLDENENIISTPNTLIVDEEIDIDNKNKILDLMNQTGVILSNDTILSNKKLASKLEHKALREVGYQDELNTNNLLFSIPSVDNKMIIEYKEYILDCRKCFDTNISKISWFNVYPENVITYNIQNKSTQMGTIDFISFPKPLPNTITGWVSIVDGRTRITDLRENITNKKKIKRGKLISNMNEVELVSISTFLDCSTKIPDIINTLKNRNLFIVSQILLQ
jgi:superfamily II DNA or RNA helicase